MRAPKSDTSLCGMCGRIFDQKGDCKPAEYCSTPCKRTAHRLAKNDFSRRKGNFYKKLGIRVVLPQ